MQDFARLKEGQAYQWWTYTQGDRQALRLLCWRAKVVHESQKKTVFLGNEGADSSGKCIPSSHSYKIFTRQHRLQAEIYKSHLELEMSGHLSLFTRGRKSLWGAHLLLCEAHHVKSARFLCQQATSNEKHTYVFREILDNSSPWLWRIAAW